MKKLIKLSGLYSFAGILPFTIVACNNTNEQKPKDQTTTSSTLKETEQFKPVFALVENTEKNSAEGYEYKAKDQVVAVATKFGISAESLSFESKNTMTALVTKKATVFSTTKDGVIQLIQVKNNKKPADGPIIGIVKGLPQGITLTKDSNPVYNDRNNQNKESGFLKVKKKDGKFEIKFRLFKKDADGKIQVSTELYTLTLD